jgi:hypothetical protein
MAAAVGATLLELVNAVCQAVGHPKTTVTSSSNDEAILRMVFYANLAGTELTYMANWQQLSKSGEISVVGLATEREKSFALPVDFATMTDDTQWNRSTQLPAVGPINPQDWQWLVVRDALITTRFMWRIRDGLLWIKSPPTSAQPFTFEYNSKYWAMNGNTDLGQETMAENNDYHIFPPQLMVLYTRAKWFENEGYDATQALLDFSKAFAWYNGTDKGATALSIVPTSGFPYLNATRNIPDTGYGSSY